MEDGKQINPEIEEQIFEYLGKLEEIAGKKFGDVNNPLLVSVRSGARADVYKRQPVPAPLECGNVTGYPP